ncbi:HNH endonuclease, partial [bacterium]|nr:HNH endonuclease [bacterium]
PLPSIVRLSRFVLRPNRKVLLSRKNVIRRDKQQCQYCGTHVGAMTVDHIIPRVRGGGDSWENLVCACMPCNTRKGRRTPREAEMKLLREPKKPGYLYFIQHLAKHADVRWKPYLFMLD